MTQPQTKSMAPHWMEEVEAAYAQHVQVLTFPKDSGQVVGLKILGPRYGQQGVAWFWAENGDVLDDVIDALEAARSALREET